MRFKNLTYLTSLMAICVVFCSLQSHASTNLRTDSFDVYADVGDVDGDGSNDLFYFASKERILILAGEIATPIVYQDSASFIVQTDGTVKEWTAAVDVSGFSVADANVLSGDFDGDGRADLFFQSNTAYENHIVYGDAAASPKQVVVMDTLEGLDLFGKTILVQDLNNDGRDDIQIIDGDETSVAFANNDGSFNETRNGVVAGESVPGAMAGEFSVGKDGSASYSIPIAVPVGGAGMQPKLAFNYSSSAGNGYLGVGWNVFSPSSISNCSTRYVDDGYIEADKYLCLDGQKLVEISPGVYYTENASFVKVEKISGRDAYRVYYKSGEIAYLGDYDGNHPEAFDDGSQSRVIAKIEDRAGNTRSYHYTKIPATNEHYITRIDYPGGEVTFFYEPRNDAIDSWQQGNHSKVLKRVSRIESNVAGVTYRSYDLDYEESLESGISRLIGITECGADGSCLIRNDGSQNDFSTAFEWSNSGYTVGDSLQASKDKSVPYSTSTSNHALDFNGDGLTDVAIAYAGTGYKVFLSDGSGKFDTTISLNCSSSSCRLDHAFPFDMDGDGAVELVIPVVPNNLSRSDIYVYRYTGSSNSSFSTHEIVQHWPHKGYLLLPLDFDGDGLTDLARVKNNSSGSVSIYKNINGSSFQDLGKIGEIKHTSQSRVWDINGDGKHELIDVEGGRYYEYVYNDATGAYEAIQKSLTGDWGTKKNAKLADVNGDGLQDLIWGKDGRWEFSINHGDGSVGPRVRVLDYGRDPEYGFYDYNDDGKVDILYIDRSGDDYRWRVLENIAGEHCYTTGEQCFIKRMEGQNLTTNNGNTPFSFGDFDGDGAEDVLVVKPGKIITFSRDIQELPNYLTRITNRYGLETEFDYGRLYDTADNADFYDRGADVDFPLRNIAGAIQVVKTTRVKKNSTGFADEVHYRYKELLMHGQGLGSLGFKEITSTTDLTRITTTYNRDWQNRTHGMTDLQVTEKRKSPADSWKEVQRVEYNNDTVVDSNYGIRYAYVPSQTETIKDLNGNVIKTTGTSYTPDTVSGGFNVNTDYGNMLQTTVTTKNADESEVHTVSTVSTYGQDDPANWILGRVTNTQVTTSATGRGSVTRESEWSYNSQGYLQSETIEPGKQELSKTTSYTYNAKGLKETVTVTTNDPNYAARSSTTYYDALGRFPTQVINDVGTASTTYDPVLGLPTMTTDINGNTSYVTYDGFGRVKQTTAADGSYSIASFHDTGLTGIESDYYQGVNADGTPQTLIASLPAIYYAQSIDQYGAWTRTYYDALGKAFETRSLNAFGDTIVVRTEYDRYGEKLRESEPYLLGATTRYWSSVVNKDALGRPLTLLNQEGNASSISYNGLSTTTTNEKGQNKTSVKGIDGKLFRVTDNDGYTVEYAYDAIGNMTSMIDLVDHNAHISNNAANDIETVIAYDDLGRKIRMDDPNKGEWFYTYNAFGELVMQQDAEGNLTCQAYDTLGRMVKRIDDYNGSATQARNHCAGDSNNPNISEWVYDTATNGKGKLHRVTGPDGYSETYVYDSLGRAIQVTKVIAGETFLTQTEYDNLGRPAKTTYPSGLDVLNHYNDLGALTEIRRVDGSGFYWQLDEVDHRGNPTTIKLANGEIVTDKTYTPERGFVDSIVSSTVRGAEDLQVDYVQYDELANVSFRTNDIELSTESAVYDSMNRLLHVDRTVNGTALPRESMSYSHNGNITNKWDISGAYQYGQSCNGITPGHNALTSANGDTYCYDRNGNMTSGNGRTIQWASFGKPVSISKGSKTIAFEYGPSRSRIRRIDTDNGNETTTTYVGSYEKVVKPTGEIDERHYIGGVLIVNQVTNGSTTTTDENYLLKDNLGSVVKTVSLNELIASSAYKGNPSSFNPWGERRHADWSSMSEAELYAYKGNLATIVTDRGFTGHEQIDDMGLIHMNGRVYDPLIGRFISADPIIQSPTDLQSLNRYSYVRNNPLSLTDPSGFSWVGDKLNSFRKTLAYRATSFGTLDKGLKEFKRFARKNKYVAEATQVIGCAVTAAPTGGMGCVVLSAAVTYSMTDGDLGATARAGATAYVMVKASMAIGSGATWSWTSADTYGRIFAHGVVGGLAAGVNGGDAKAGFLTSIAGKAATVGLSNSGWDLYDIDKNGDFTNTSPLEKAIRTVVAATIGGTISDASGGTFANGARTAAMQHLFNAEYVPDPANNMWEVFKREIADWWASGDTEHLRNGIQATVDVATIPYRAVKLGADIHDGIELTVAIKNGAYEDAAVRAVSLLAGKGVSEYLSVLKANNTALQDSASLVTSKATEAVLKEDCYSCAHQ